MRTITRRETYQDIQIDKYYKSRKGRNVVKVTNVSKSTVFYKDVLGNKNYASKKLFDHLYVQQNEEFISIRILRALNKNED